MLTCGSPKTPGTDARSFWQLPLAHRSGRLPILAALSMLSTGTLQSCSSAPQLKFAEALETENPPSTTIHLWVERVGDLSGSYQQQLEFYRLTPSLEDRVRKVLEQSEFTYRSGSGFVSHVTNPFTAATDSASADALLRIGVVEFGFGKKEEIGVALSIPAFGLLPHGYMALACQLHRPGKQLQYEFDAVGVSTKTEPRADALEEAMSAAAQSVAEELLEPSSFH